MKPATSDEVTELLGGFLPTASLGTVMELGLFWQLAEQLRAAEDIAQRHGLLANCCVAWLE